MEQKRSQELNFNLEGVEFIVFKPFSETYYQYNLNSVDENGHLIERHLASQLVTSEFIFLQEKIHYLTCRFRSFIFIKKLRDIRELNPNDDTLDEEIKKSIMEFPEAKIENKGDFKDLHANIFSNLPSVEKKHNQFLKLFL